MERKINETAAITVYPNGYALYEADGAATVFPVHPCGDYCYGFSPYVCTVSARLFEKEAWYIRLVLEGEDRLFRNLETSLSFFSLLFFPDSMLCFHWYPLLALFYKFVPFYP